MDPFSRSFNFLRKGLRVPGEQRSHFLRKGSMFWVVMVFFFLGFVPGAWIPTASLLLKSMGHEWATKYVFLPMSFTAVLAPLVFGSMADNKVPANRILTYAAVAITIFVWFSFRMLSWGWSPWWFLCGLTCFGFAMAPAWAMSSVVALDSLKNPDKHFALVRIGATVGWPLAGVCTGSVFHLTHSPDVGNLSAVAGALLIVCCLMLPHTPPPEATSKKGTWKTALGLDALSLFKENDQRVFFITAGLSAIPLMSIYMHTPLHLEELGDKSPTSTLALGQISEVVAMIVLGSLLLKLRARSVLLIALLAGLVRFALFALAGGFDSLSLLVLGVPLHGIVFGFWYVTGQLFLERRVDRSLRAQAQSLLNVIYMGLGGLSGTLVVDFWYKYSVKTKESWEIYWWGLFVMLFIATAYFVICYHSKRPSKMSANAPN